MDNTEKEHEFTIEVNNKYVCISNYFRRGSTREIIEGEILTLREIADIQWRISQDDMYKYFCDLSVYRDKQIRDILDIE